MKKKEIIRAIAEQANLSLNQMEEIFNVTFATIQKIMIEQGSVSIPGFGNFVTKVRAERKGRNPSTGKEILIPKAIVPTFKAALQLKESVNSTKDKE